MAENGVDEARKANGKGGSEQGLDSSGFAGVMSSVMRNLTLAVDMGRSMTTEHTSLAFRTDALRTVSVRCAALDLIRRREKREVKRRTTRRVERRIPSSKHGVKSNSLRAETGPHPSRWPWYAVLHVAIDDMTSNGADASLGNA